MVGISLLIIALAILLAVVAFGCVATLAMPKSSTRDVIFSVLLALMSSLYVLLPVDLLPAGLLGPIGVTDDVAVLLMSIKKIRALLHKSENACGDVVLANDNLGFDRVG